MLIPGSDITAARQKIYARHIHGRYRTLRTAISLFLQGILFVIPWVQWNGRQALLADVAGRKLYLFGMVFHPQDTYFLQILMITAAFLLFSVSALAGRMWCGFACPQTIFTQSFMLVERWMEGDRPARQRLDKAPWTPQKVRTKVAKWSIWTVMGCWLGITYSGYFLPIRTTVSQLLNGQVDLTVGLAVLFFASIALFDFGYFREQFCWLICPYARFQGTMMDSNSLIVGYDSVRGEPRGKAKDNSRGSCIDCRACVQACPAGIDIRNGLQMECIACTACMDACDEIMDKVHQPRGLVRYTSLNALEGRPTRVLRPRMVAYGVVLLGLFSLLTYLIATRPPLAVQAVRVVQPGGQLASTTPDGHVANIFKIQLVNRLAEPQKVWLEVEGLKGAELVGLENPVLLNEGQVFEAQAFLLVPPTTGRGPHPFQLRVRNQAQLCNTAPGNFFVP